MKTQVIVLAAAMIVGVIWAEEAQTEINKTKPILPRIKNRDIPSVFQAWNQSETLPDHDPNISRYDLIFMAPEALGLKWNNEFVGLANGFTAETLQSAQAKRENLLDKNNNLVILAEIRYYDADPCYLPTDHAWFLRDANGIPQTIGKNFKLNINNSEFCEQIARMAKAAVDSNVFDGIMLNIWKDDNGHLELIKAIRKAIGPNPMILCNSNDLTTPATAPYINGYYMRCTNTDTPEGWQRIAETLQWAAGNLRKPTINCLETFYRNSNGDPNLMRAATTLTMAVSDGYCLFSDANPLQSPNHSHAWYPFWDIKAGKPLAAGKKDDKGCYTRAYERGLVIYNPMGNAPATYTFPKPVKSAATGKAAAEHTINPCDGDILLNLPDEPIVPAAN